MPPTSLTFSSSLIPDCLQTTTPPVADDLTAKLVVVQETGAAPEILTVDPSGALQHLRHDATSGSGWGQTAPAVPVPPSAASSAASRLVGFYEGGVLNALVHFPVAGIPSNVVTWMQRDGAGNWSSLPLEADLGNALGQTNQTDTYEAADGTHYIYGVSTYYGDPTFFVVARDPASGAFTVRMTADAMYLAGVDPNGSPPAFRLFAGAGSTPLVALWAIGGKTYFQGIEIGSDGTFSWSSDPAASLDLGQPSSSIDQIVAFPGSAAQHDFLLLGHDSQIYLI